ncbi:MAG: hypothetical protein ACI35P_07960 [Bacillus sp. (in: firmicutes)]
MKKSTAAWIDDEQSKNNPIPVGILMKIPRDSEVLKTLESIPSEWYMILGYALAKYREWIHFVYEGERIKELPVYEWPEDRE